MSASTITGALGRRVLGSDSAIIVHGGAGRRRDLGRRVLGGDSAIIVHGGADRRRDLGRRVLGGDSAIIVHGGAGHTQSELFERLREGVRAAAQTGDAILVAGGSALDAVVAA